MGGEERCGRKKKKKKEISILKKIWRSKQRKGRAWIEKKYSVNINNDEEKKGWEFEAVIRKAWQNPFQYNKNLVCEFKGGGGK